MPHKKTSTCPNPYTVYRSLKKTGAKLPKYDEWKAHLMVIAGGNKSRFTKLVAEQAPPAKTLKETYARKLRSIAKDIRKDMRHRFKVDRDTARGAVADIIQTLASEVMDDKDDSTIVTHSTTDSSTIKIGKGEGYIKYVPNPKSIYDALKKEDPDEMRINYDEWKAYYVLQAGGPKKTRRFREMMADLANGLNDGDGMSIIRSAYVHKLRRAMREITKDIVTCKNKTRAEAKDKVRDLLLSINDNDDDATIVSHAESTPRGATFRKGRPGYLKSIQNSASSSPSGNTVVTNATGLESMASRAGTFVRDRTRWLRRKTGILVTPDGEEILSPPSMDPENRSVLGKLENVLQGLPANATEEEREEAAYDDPVFGYASYRQSSFNGIPPSFYPRHRSRGIAPRRW